MIEELNELFESTTIKPTFDYVHIILALYIFEKNPEGIGRYRLKKDLLIGSGTARSLITKLNEKTNFIKVVDENSRKGHILTETGLKFLNKIKKKIPIIEEGDLSVLKDIIIDFTNTFPYYCLIKDAAHKITNGIAQRDAAIKINGTGATCLIYDGKNLIFPSRSFSESDENLMKIEENVQKYFKTQILEANLKLEKNDVIIIGLGASLETARLVALNSALTLI